MFVALVDQGEIVPGLGVTKNNSPSASCSAIDGPYFNKAFNFSNVWLVPWWFDFPTKPMVLNFEIIFKNKNQR